MCNQIDYFLLDYFMLNDTAIMEAVCRSGDEQIPPRPFSPAIQGEGRQDEAVAVKNSFTVLYAVLVATGAESEPELKDLCTRAPDYADSLNAELLNATVYRDTICATEEPISIDLARSAIFTWATRVFITMIENISNVDEWRGWLCDHVDVKGMNSVMLYGDGVRMTICDDASS